MVVIISSYPYKSYLYTFWHLYILKFYSILYLFLLFFNCNYSKYNYRRWEVSSRVRKVVAMPLVNSINHIIDAIEGCFRQPSSYETLVAIIYFIDYLSLLSWLLYRLLRAVPLLYIEALSLHIPAQHSASS